MTGLASFATGFAAARALRGRTMAADRVLFEPGAAVDVTAPTLVIYAAAGGADMEGRQLLDAASFVSLRIEMFLPCGVEISAGDGDWSLDTSASLALAFAIFWRQCEAALSARQGGWADLFRSIVLDMKTMGTAADLIPLETGMRVAARSVEIAAMTIDSPPIGVAPSGKWAAFVAAMRSDSEEVASLADLVEATIHGEDDLLDWQVDFAWLGLSQSTGGALGVAPDGDVQNMDEEATIEAPATPAAEPQA